MTHFILPSNDFAYGIQLEGNAEAGLTRLHILNTPDAANRQSPESEANPFLAMVENRLKRYFVGKTDTFADIPLAPLGTPFQQQVWEALRQIPWGETRSYRWLAAQVPGKANAYRAVGSANGRNPWPIIVPCHRVIQTNGGIGGYTGGLDVKRRLLSLEGVNELSPCQGDLLLAR